MGLLDTLRIAVIGVAGTYTAIAIFKHCRKTNSIPSFFPKALSQEPPLSDSQKKFIRFRDSRLLPLLFTSFSSLSLTYLGFRSYIPSLIPTTSAGLVTALSGITLLLSPSHSFQDGVWKTPLGEEALTPLQAHMTLGLYSFSLGYFLKSCGVSFSRLLPFAVAGGGVFMGHGIAAKDSTGSVPYVLKAVVTSTIVGNWLLGEVFKGTRRGVLERDSVLLSLLSLGVGGLVLGVQSGKWRRGEKGGVEGLVVQDAFYLQGLVLFGYYCYCRSHSKCPCGAPGAPGFLGAVFFCSCLIKGESRVHNLAICSFFWGSVVVWVLMGGEGGEKDVDCPIGW